MKAVVVGEICIDNYLYPIREKYVGGNATNVAVWLSRYGIETSLVGAIGTDEEGKKVLNVLKNERVDISHLKIIPGVTAYSDIKVKDGERFIIKEEFGVANSYQLSENDLNFIFEHNLIHITLNGNDGINNYLNSINDKELIVSFDYSEGNKIDFVKETLSFADIIFLSKAHLRIQEVEELGKKIVNKGPKIAVITMGERGSIAFTKDSIIRQSAVPVPKVIDTLGAGDAFIGAFLACILKNIPIKAALEEAALCASRVCQHFGGWNPF